MDSANSDFKSKVKSFFSKTSKKIKLEKIIKKDNYKPDITNNGLLSEGVKKAKDERIETIADDKQNIITTSRPVEKNVQLEKMQEGFNNLVTQLNSINNNLDQQIHHQQQLIERLDKLPQLFESFAPSIMNQQQLTEQMIEELKSASIKNTQFIESVERIPNETAKQTDALENIDHQLAAAAASDAQMANSFKNFKNSIENLDQTASTQTDSIMQMSKTFAASDRYLKYIIARDKKRMFWLFAVTITVCVAAIVTLAGIIIYLNN